MHARTHPFAWYFVCLAAMKEHKTDTRQSVELITAIIKSRVILPEVTIHLQYRIQLIFYFFFDWKNTIIFGFKEKKKQFVVQAIGYFLELSSAAKGASGFVVYFTSVWDKSLPQFCLLPGNWIHNISRKQQCQKHVCRVFLFLFFPLKKEFKRLKKNRIKCATQAQTYIPSFYILSKIPGLTNKRNMWDVL